MGIAIPLAAVESKAFRKESSPCAAAAQVCAEAARETSGKKGAEVHWRTGWLKSQQRTIHLGKGERKSLQRWVQGSSCSTCTPPSPVVRHRAGGLVFDHWLYPAAEVLAELWVVMRVGDLQFFAPGSYSALLGTCTELPDASWRILDFGEWRVWGWGDGCGVCVCIRNKADVHFVTSLWQKWPSKEHW